MRISLRHLHRAYGSLHAVHDISLDIPSNTIYGIIGKSGAGKSTLVRLISLLEAPDSGEIFYDDTRVDNLAKDELITQRRKIGMIFQNFNLFSSRNAAENIAYPLEIAGVPKDKIQERVKELLELVGLTGRGKAPISTLSGGQMQRVAIARALANNPDIIFCDEATSALDPQTTRSILDLLKDLQKRMNLSVVMITHQMEVVRDACEYVAVLENGSVVEEGKVIDVFAKPGSSITKEFLANLAPLVEDEQLKKSDMVRWSQEGGRYTLRFRGELTGEPVLSRIQKRYDVEINIRAGGIQHVSGEEVGTLICDIIGETEEVEKAVAALQLSGILVEEEGMQV
ncbi:MAG: methionine ABC transporter ATP-binding protein [Sphaerochaetaceae bacterium]|jgi:D-methionine transport system ATP-binding protein|nr:methionine ABC transporter ATP-binding protein [Sphaerochaetaceae bacterium]MDD4220653.1 methionine ABC transporter ATP-binding protein [Sphaerochaetaceae bacterium]MDY0370975.1 methionine ABC transporter ATP-binding protein [Sphaerochaetaceae bacterium]